MNKDNRQAAYLADLTFENEDAGTELVSQIAADLRKTGTDHHQIELLPSTQLLAGGLESTELATL